MKGDFSDLAYPDDQPAILIQQGQPLLDSQINALLLKAFSPHVLSDWILENFKKPAKNVINASESSLLFDHIKIDISKTRLDAELDSINLKSIKLNYQAENDNETTWKTNLLLGRFIPPEPVDYVLYLQPTLATLGHSPEPIFNGHKVVQVLPSPRFGLATTEEWKEIETRLVGTPLRKGKHAPLQLQNINSENQTIRFEVHCTANKLENGTFEKNQIHQIKWALNNAGLVFDVAKDNTGRPKIEGSDVQVETTGLSSFVHANRFVELEFDKGTTFGTQLYQIKSVDQNRLSLYKDVDPGVLNAVRSVRIWDGVHNVTAGQIKKGILQFNTNQFQASFEIAKPKVGDPTSFQSTHFLPGDFWMVRVRNGEQESISYLQNDGHTPFAFGTLKPTEFTPQSSEDAAAPDENPPLPLPAPSQPAQSIKSLMDSPSASLSFELENLAVKRWLASTNLKEIAHLSQSQLKQRVLADCCTKEYDNSTLDKDLELVIARRDKILSATFNV